MMALAQKSMAAEEFTTWAEARPEKRWKLFDGAPELQPRQNIGHSRTVWNAVTALPHRQLGGSPPRLSSPGMRGAGDTRDRPWGLVLLEPPGLALNVSRIFAAD